MSDTPANDLLPRVAVLEEIAASTKATLERIERRLDAMETQIDTRFSRVDTRLDRMSSDQRSDFRWLLGMVIAWGAGLLGVMARAQHWL